MARIRSIKPEFWDSPSTARASAVARLAYIAMWNWADDYGRGTANLKELEGFVFPNDDVHELSGGHARYFRDVVAEVETCFEVLFYTHDGRPYYEIPAWDAHQRNERRAKQSRHPGPYDEGSTLTPLNSANLGNDEGSPDDARYVRRAVAETPRTSGPGTGEQGNRGTGEQGKELARPSGPSVSRFDEFWSIYPRKVGKQTAVSKYKAAVKRAGDEQTVIDGAQRLAADPNLPEKKYIPHPKTWLERDGWEDEPLPSASGRGNTNDTRSTPKGYDPADWLRPSNEPAFDYIDAEVVQLREIGR